MKAVRFHSHGGIDRLKFEDCPDPKPGPGEVVLRVRACALNHLDLWERKGLPGIKLPLPHISGSDIAGVIDSTGDGVNHLKTGEKAIVCPGLSCMRCESCLGGKDNECRSYSVLGYWHDGGYAELVKVPAANIFPYPGEIEFEQAAALPLVFMTAWHMLVTRCSIRAGDDVLVIGAGSGVGSAAIQVAKFFHARVIATAGNEGKLQRALELGADFVINHSSQSIREEVKKITARRGADIVFEHVGMATWAESLASIAPGGRLVTCGATTGHEASIDLRHLFVKQISLLGSYMGTKAELWEILRLVRDGYFHPVVSAVLPLSEAARAQDMMEKREHYGKIVLQI
jgi:NADPH:quinone reductase-like Zn-dependent oxidoreductase